jgi:MarR family transcriptional regulator, organic hydroperoxide resistance regulator
VKYSEGEAVFDYENVVDLIIENAKKLFFPEEWINLDLKFSKFEMFTMMYLDKRNEMTMSELVEYLNSPMSTATGIADRLVKKGYILRDRSESDRRIVILRLTEEGSRLIKNFKDMIAEYLNMILDDLTDEEKKFLVHIILKIVKNMQAKLNSQTSLGQDKTTIKNIEIE